MSDFINTVDLIGDEVLTNRILDRSITEIADENVKTIGMYSFSTCKALTTVNFPGATEIGIHAFEYCTALKTISFPSLTLIQQFAFEECSALTAIRFPMLETIKKTAFVKCYALTTADFFALTSIENYVFNVCSKLKTLILRGATMCTAGGSGLLDGTLIANGTGYIYVPRALVDTYKAASNWSNFAAQFRALEDYTVDGTTTGELDTTKI